MTVDRLNEIFDAQPDVNLLPVDEEGRCGFDLGVLSALDVLQDLLLDFRRPHGLHEFVDVETDAGRQSYENGLRIRTARPFHLMFEDRVVHLPVFTLFASRVPRRGCRHRVRMDGNQREMMKFQPDLRWITVQNLLNYGMECPATRTLIVPKLN